MKKVEAEEQRTRRRRTKDDKKAEQPAADKTKPVNKFCPIEPRARGRRHGHTTTLQGQDRRLLLRGLHRRSSTKDPDAVHGEAEVSRRQPLEQGPASEARRPSGLLSGCRSVERQTSEPTYNQARCPRRRTRPRHRTPRTGDRSEADARRRRDGLRELRRARREGAADRCPASRRAEVNLARGRASCGSTRTGPTPSRSPPPSPTPATRPRPESPGVAAGNVEEERLQRQTREARAWFRRAVVGVVAVVPARGDALDRSRARQSATRATRTAAASLDGLGRRCVTSTIAIVYVGGAFYRSAVARPAPRHEQHGHAHRDGRERGVRLQPRRVRRLPRSAGGGRCPTCTSWNRPACSR